MDGYVATGKIQQNNSQFMFHYIKSYLEIRKHQAFLSIYFKSNCIKSTYYLVEKYYSIEQPYEKLFQFYYFFFNVIV